MIEDFSSIAGIFYEAGNMSLIRKLVETFKPTILKVSTKDLVIIGFECAADSQCNK